jgi:hypothetical protein
MTTFEFIKRDYSKVIRDACRCIEAGDREGAEHAINERYPFVPLVKGKRQYTPRQMTEVFVRDGFIDRYRGTRLVYPPALRVLSIYMPAAFPYHKNGKMDSGHIAYWELFPTIDHIDPVAREGPDHKENWVCCSMLTNSIKSNWTLDQLGWELLPGGAIAEWDGMIGWFIKQMGKDKALNEVPYLKAWFSAANDIMMHNNSLHATALSGRA